jgi:NAD(P)-dependent dehydrogenase (short-subunit alcohol dehydrogenase family)
MRTYVVTGSASGIGAATREILEARGDRVVGVDLRDADLMVDLANPHDRATLYDQVRAAGVNVVDGVLPAAGLSAGLATASKVLAVNYFGAVSTVVQLAGLLAASSAPRVCMISSIGLISRPNDTLTSLCIAGDENAALAQLADDDTWIYERSKRAISAWVRINGVALDWLDRGILINAIAPGLVATKMSERIIDSPEILAELFETYPHPLGVGRATDIAHLASFLLSAENAFMAGQTIFVDGGHEAICGPVELPLRPVLPTKTSSNIAKTRPAANK